jgi:high-affinity iron transporter
VALVGLVLFVRTVGFRLPMQALFKGSTVLLVVTAVMLLGKGLHGLQELGVLPLSPVTFVKVEPLGVYPDLCWRSLRSAEIWSGGQVPATLCSDAPPAIAG